MGNLTCHALMLTKKKKKKVYQKDSSCLPLFPRRKEMQNGLVFWIQTTTKWNVEDLDKGHDEENEVLVGKRWKMHYCWEKSIIFAWITQQGELEEICWKQYYSSYAQLLISRALILVQIYASNWTKFGLKSFNSPRGYRAKTLLQTVS